MRVYGHRFGAGAVMALALLMAGCSSSPTVYTGQFVYMADAASFTSCADGERYPVAMEAAYIDLERGYLAAQSRPGAPLLVEVEGTIESRPPMEGQGTVPTLVVQRFLGCFPGETCGNSGATSTLTNSYWKLTRLGGAAVARFPNQREPHLIFRANEQRLAGSGGCNALNGSFEQDGSRLTLSIVAATLMACPDGQEQEQRFLSALTEVTSWRITGVHLDLLDADGIVLARLEDTPLT